MESATRRAAEDTIRTAKGIDAGCVIGSTGPGRPDRWRPDPESNRGARICSPLHSHSAIRPDRGADIGPGRPDGQAGRRSKRLSRRAAIYINRAGRVIVAHGTMLDYRAARLNMVEGQIRTNKVTDANVLDAFLTVPRERFVPDALTGSAYVDEDIPLGGGRYLTEPLVLARLLQLAEIGPGDGVLEIGAATGYATAILSRFAGRVIAVESDVRLAGLARQRLQELGAGNVTLLEGRLEEGYPAGAPYEAIVFSGAVASVPEAIARQLAEGGRLVAVTRPHAGMGQAVVMTRTAGVLSQRPVFDAGVALLPGFAAAPSFVF
jgi:protein-L-isoaspartate(D-aspartate) O-methyltransferase